MNLDCFEVKEKLSEYIDDMLNQNEKEDIREHISTCAECAREYNELCCIVNELSSLPTEALPSDFFDKLNKRLGKRKKRLYFAHAIKGFSTIAAGLMLLLLIRTGYYSNINQIKTAYVDDAPIDLQQEDTAQETPLMPHKQFDEQQNTPEVSEPSPSQSPNTSLENASNNEERAQTEKAGIKQTPQPTDEQSKTQHNDFNDVEIESQPRTQEPALFNDGGNKQADAYVQHDDAPAESSRMMGAQENAVMYQIFADEDEAETAAEESENKTPAPTISPKFSASSHDMETPEFVSVIIRVGDFEGAATVLKEKYNAQIKDGVISLKLSNEDFQDVMNLMLEYQARVQQRETEEPLTYNECVIVPD
jgi:hypothetical protein